MRLRLLGALYWLTALRPTATAPTEKHPLAASIEDLRTGGPVTVPRHPPHLHGKFLHITGKRNGTLVVHSQFAKLSSAA